MSRLSYYCIRVFTFPLSFLPYRALHALGRFAGTLGFYCLRAYRKRALSNLSLAPALQLQSEAHLFRIARESFQNLAINCLEYARFARESHFANVIECENPQEAADLHKRGVGLIFFCGHLSNWETLFLDGTTRMRGIAIGKPTRNDHLYQWIVSIRQKNGGLIIDPRRALKEGLRHLRRGTFLGIVGDQGMPDSGYTFPFLGRNAYTSTAPALLSYRTGSPILVATTRRVRGGYKIRYSPPLYPDLTRPLDEEVPRLMDQALTHLQNAILQSPGEWLWQHNRWKQLTPEIVYKRFRHDAIGIVLPEDPAPFREAIETLRTIYPTNFLTTYTLPLPRDYRPKLIFNFTSSPLVAPHFERLSAFETLDIPALKQLATPYTGDDLSELLKRALTRPNTLWKDSTPTPL